MIFLMLAFLGIFFTALPLGTDYREITNECDQIFNLR